MKITLIVGLPGSGKTHFATSLLSSSSQLIDDYSVNGDVEVEDVYHLIITDPLCIQYGPDRIKKFLKDRFPNSTLSIIAFENNPQQCIINSRCRDKIVSRHFIQMLSTVYSPTEWSETIIPVWNG